MTTGYCLVMITARSHRDAESLGRSAVETRLAAKADVLGPYRVFERVNNTVSVVREWQIRYVTTEPLYPALADHLAAHHPGPLADVVRIAIDAATPQYLLWVNAETVGAG